jgi:hypothetical protein
MPLSRFTGFRRHADTHRMAVSPATPAFPAGAPNGLRAAIAVAALVSALTLLLLAVAIGRYVASGDGIGGDFLTDYAGGYLVRTGDGSSLYDVEVQETAQQELSPAGDVDDVNPFVLPPLAAWIFAPMTLMPYRVAHVLFTLVNLSLLASAVWLLREELRAVPAPVRNALLFAFAFSMPAVTNISWGQVDLLLVLGALLCWRAMRSGNDVLAGSALCLMLLKPQFAVGILALLVVRRRWRALAPVSVVFPVALIAPAIALGPDALRDYWDLVTGATHLPAHIDTQPQHMANWRGFMNTLSGGDSPIVWLPGAVLIVGAATIATFRVWREDAASPRAFAIACTLPLLVSPHLHMQSMMLLFVAIALMTHGGPRELRLPNGWRVGMADALLYLHGALFVAWFATANEIAVMVLISVAVFAWCAFAPLPQRSSQARPLVRAA